VIDHRVITSTYSSCLVYCDHNSATTENKIISIDNIRDLPDEKSAHIICKSNKEILKKIDTYEDHLLFKMLNAHKEYIIG